MYVSMYAGLELRRLGLQQLGRHAQAKARVQSLGLQAWLSMSSCYPEAPCAYIVYT